MALDKLTFFEIHLDGAQFGRKSTSDTDAADESTDETTADEADAADETGGSRRLLALLGVGVLVAVVAWRRRGDDQTTVDDFAESEDGELDADLADSDAELDEIDA